jgi:predicted DNA-binding ribbon-helix-helix protein
LTGALAALVIAIVGLLIIMPQSSYGMRFARQQHQAEGLVPMAHLRGRNLASSDTKRSTKRSIAIADHKTSISLEDEFWNSLKEIARERDMTVAELVAAIDGDRRHANLSSAIRLFVLGFYRDQRR